MKKKVLAILLVIAMVLGMTATFVLAEDNDYEAFGMSEDDKAMYDITIINGNGNVVLSEGDEGKLAMSKTKSDKANNSFKVVATSTFDKDNDNIVIKVNTIENAPIMDIKIDNTSIFEGERTIKEQFKSNIELDFGETGKYIKLKGLPGIEGEKKISNILIESEGNQGGEGQGGQGQGGEGQGGQGQGGQNAVQQNHLRIINTDVESGGTVSIQRSQDGTPTPIEFNGDVQFEYSNGEVITFILTAPTNIPEASRTIKVEKVINPNTQNAQGEIYDPATATGECTIDMPEDGAPVEIKIKWADDIYYYDSFQLDDTDKGLYEISVQNGSVFIPTDSPDKLMTSRTYFADNLQKQKVKAKSGYTDTDTIVINCNMNNPREILVNGESIFNDSISGFSFNGEKHEFTITGLPGLNQDKEASIEFVFDNNNPGGPGGGPTNIEPNHYKVINTNGMSGGTISIKDSKHTTFEDITNVMGDVQYEYTNEETVTIKLTEPMNILEESRHIMVIENINPNSPNSESKQLIPNESGEYFVVMPNGMPVEFIVRWTDNQEPVISGGTKTFTINYNTEHITSLTWDKPIEGVSMTPTQGKMTFSFDGANAPMQLDLKMTVADGCGIVSDTQLGGSLLLSTGEYSIYNIAQCFADKDSYVLNINSEKDESLLSAIEKKHNNSINLSNIIKPTDTYAISSMLENWCRDFSKELGEGVIVRAEPINTNSVWVSVFKGMTTYSFKGLPFNITYAEEYDTDILAKTDKIIADGKFDEVTSGKGYTVEDMDVIYMLRDFGGFYEGVNKAVKYSSDFRKDISGYNFKFEFDGQGGGGGSDFYTNFYFATTMSFNNLIYKYVFTNFKIGRVIYVDVKTKNTDEFIAAAKQKIKEKTGIDVEIEKEASFNDYFEEKYSITSDTYEMWENRLKIYVDTDTTCKEVYTLTMDGKEYDFLISNDISKASDSNMVVTKDVSTDAQVSALSKNVPLDTTVAVQVYEKGNTIHDNNLQAIGLKEGVTYDIELNSAAKQQKIETIDKEKGVFEVIVPVPESYFGTDVKAYYVNGNGEKETYAAEVIKDGEDYFAKFNTNHFSAYTIGQDNNLEPSEPEEHTHDLIVKSCEWANDYSSATIKLICKDCDFETEGLAATVKVEYNEDSTCEKPGKTGYIATVKYDNVNYESKKEVGIVAKGHDYTGVEPTWEWAADYSTATATFVCARDNCEHKHKVTVTSSSDQTVTPNCTQKGNTRYTAKAKAGDECGEFTDYVDVEIAALGHDWNDGDVTKATVNSKGFIEYHCKRTGCTETKREEFEQKSEDLGISDEIIVSEAIREAGLTTEEEVKEKIEDAVIEKSGFDAKNVKTYEITLKVSYDNGKTYQIATAGDIPAEGLLITIPYPEGTSKKDSFVIAHMYAETTKEHKAGDVEILDIVDKTDDGIQVVVHSLSPFAVGYKLAENPAQQDGPKTGDSNNSTLWIFMGIGALVLAGATLFIYRKKTSK